MRFAVDLRLGVLRFEPLVFEDLTADSRRVIGWVSFRLHKF